MLRNFLRKGRNKVNRAARINHCPLSREDYTINQKIMIKGSTIYNLRTLILVQEMRMKALMKKGIRKKISMKIIFIKIRMNNIVEADWDNISNFNQIFQIRG